MRRVPAKMAAIWHSGDFTGANRPIARATVQHGAVNLYNVSANKVENTYASIVFGPSEVPKELPNLKSVAWTRSVDTATATGQLVFYNTRPLQIGETPTRDLDGLGYYTYNRGQTSFANRWGQVPNEWANTLIPDNLIRTYEGYGCDPSVIPEHDPNLLQSGLWIIDDVEYTHNGLITVSVSDLSRILSTQIIFPPVIPKAFYPLSFGGVPSHSGLRAPTLFTYTVDTGGMHDPAHPPPADYGGPLDGPVNVTVTSADLQVHVTWQRPLTPDSNPTGSVDQRGIQTGATPTKGFQVIGYRLIVDGVRLPTIYPATATSTDIPGEVLMNGNVYAVHVVAIWKELLNPAGEFYFKSNVELEEVSDYSQPVLYARPGAGPTAHAVPGSIAPNFSAALQLAPGQLHFGYVDGGVDIDWTCVAYLPKPDYSKPILRRVGQPVPLDRYIFGVHTKAGQGVTAAFDVNVLGDLEDWNYLVFGRQTGTVVRDDQTATFPGDMFFATTPGNFAFYAPPVTGAPAHDPGPAPTVPTITKGTITTPLSATQIGAHYDDSSNTYYIGYGGNVAEHGHTADMAFDGDPNTYWLSIGNATPNAGFSYEWIQAAIPEITVTQVQFTTALANYQVYISVLAKGVWVQHAPLDIIGYNPRLPESHNHGNIPFCEYTTTGPDEGPHTVTFRTPIPGATKVRISLHNLQDFPVSGYHFRGGMKDFQVLGMGEVPVDLATAAPVVAGPPQDDNSPNIFKSYTVYTPPRIEPGAGENPGTYEDYSDIVKLFCAWGGFFWPEKASTVISDGSEVQYDFGIDQYGLPNVDPILGTDGSGRVWGDFEQTNTHGPALIPVQQWDKKPLLDGINFIKEIIGFTFFIDEQGGVIWRNPNIFSVGNWVSNFATDAGRVSNMVVIDEQDTLIGLRSKLSGRNVRERNFIASVDGRYGALNRGFNPNPIGLRRIGGWTDQHFLSTAECQVMADLIGIRQLLSYRTDTVTISGFPAIQCDDQVQIFEQVTGEGFVHYVKAINNSLDMEAGSWTYTLDTNWLGEKPFGSWAFNPAELAPETQTYLDSLKIPAGAAVPEGGLFT